jgi:TatA/E family protein of Tat protein translocase
MFGLGLWELVLVAGVIVVIFGAGRLPAWGEALGRSAKELSSATRVPTEAVDQEEGKGARPEGDLLTTTVLPELKKAGLSRLMPGKLRWLGRLTGLNK